VAHAEHAPYYDLISNIKNFDKALIAGDTVRLNELLDDEIGYGHSNGWIQTKRDLINDLYNGKLTYTKISTSDEKLVVKDKNASMRMTAEVDIVLNGSPLQFKLKVLQVWVKKKKHWVLFARQSVKV
jgi:hypothetical protein